MSPADSKVNIVDEKLVDTLVVGIQQFVKQIFYNGDLFVHQRVDEFYYMEKAEELRVLCERIDELRARLTLLENQRLECYNQVNEKLHVDKAWLDEYKSPNSCGM